MTEKILHALKPKNLSDWDRWPITTNLKRKAYDIARWHHKRTGIQVLSAVEVVADENAGPGAMRPEYHISVSRWDFRTQTCERVSSNDARAIMAMFPEEGFLEDNHVAGGKVRNFWRPIAEPAVGEPCRCVDDEVEIREDKGDFIWRGIR